METPLFNAKRIVHKKTLGSIVCLQVCSLTTKQQTLRSKDCMEPRRQRKKILIIQVARCLEIRKKKYRVIIDKLLAEILSADPNLIVGLPRTQQSYNFDGKSLVKMSRRQDFHIYNDETQACRSSVHVFRNITAQERRDSKAKC
uniref:Uncharacterized protein n=1 Tax=Romanomermis culicivorax TaxID=13658 RepID=A0A915IYR2_ROMCU